ncbi:DUF982 domain-containing protein [Mesorhizobium caraganae]|uniref:DUF982 domain-containing protein n=1 Tax=Mesorhizobium caraganae TaxID=483206 RepID=UPI001786ED3F|nr:DUF982 domain-containing protein [Mesorhizobium caraganae]MBM2712803.1 DUF982 domain-containing protein [Mesorhizobium caraganae]
MSYEAWFSKPVSVATGLSGDIRTLISAQQAIQLLTTNWRDTGSEKHIAALRVCRQAVRGGISPDVARTTFVEAARAAHMLVE